MASCDPEMTLVEPEGDRFVVSIFLSIYGNESTLTLFWKVGFVVK